MSSPLPLQALTPRNSDFQLAEVAVPTQSGQQLLDLLCDRMNQHGLAYETAAIGETATVVRWVSKSLRIPVRSAAGVLSHLISGRLMNSSFEWESPTSHPNINSLRPADFVSITPAGWYRWQQFDLSKIEWAEDLDHWVSWDGIDGTEVGYEESILHHEVCGSA